MRAKEETRTTKEILATLTDEQRQAWVECLVKMDVLYCRFMARHEAKARAEAEAEAAEKRAAA